jgi:hypothetical protein
MSKKIKCSGELHCKQQSSSEDDSEKQYEIEEIIKHRILKDKKSLEFKVKWKSFGLDDCTWEAFDVFA